MPNRIFSATANPSRLKIKDADNDMFSNLFFKGNIHE